MQIYINHKQDNALTHKRAVVNYQLLLYYRHM